MSYNSTIFMQVMQEVNKYEFKNQVSKHKGDKGASVFKCYQILVAMIFSNLKRKISLRDIEIGFGPNKSDFYHLNISNIKRSSLSDALKSRPNKVFEDFYFYLYNQLTRTQKRKSSKLLRQIDSTTLSMCLSQFPWAEFRESKSGVKMHVMLDNELKTPVELIITEAKKHDNKVCWDFKIESGLTYVFDRGYNDFKWWNKIHKADSFFVTRLKSNAKFENISEKIIGNNEGVQFDNTIKLNDDYPETLRHIRYYAKEIDKIFNFVTNDFESSAEEIADVYKNRWRVETFFKWIKQNLKIKKFYSTSKNGVLIQLWCCMITYILLLMIKEKILIPIDLLFLLRIIQDNMEKRIHLSELILFKNPSDKKKSCQKELKF